MVPPGLRWLLDAMAAVASETFTSSSAPIQYAAIRAFEGGPDIDDYLDLSRRVLDGLGRCLAARLRRAGARVVEPQGGFYLFPDFSPLSERLAARGITTSAALCERALTEANVAFLPGSHFGRPPGELTARIAYVNFDGAAAIDALDADTVVDDDFLERRCGETVAATEAICDWLDG